MPGNPFAAPEPAEGDRGGLLRGAPRSDAPDWQHAQPDDSPPLSSTGVTASPRRVESAGDEASRDAGTAVAAPAQAAGAPLPRVVTGVPPAAVTTAGVPAGAVGTPPPAADTNAAEVGPAGYPPGFQPPPAGYPPGFPAPAQPPFGAFPANGGSTGQQPGVWGVSSSQYGNGQYQLGSGYQQAPAWTAGGYDAASRPPSYQPFEQQAVAQQERMRCMGWGEQWTIFIIGLLVWPLWYVGSIWYCVSARQQQDPRQRIPFILNCIAAFIFTFIWVAIVVRNTWTCDPDTGTCW